MNGPKILVIGASGMVGLATVEKLSRYSGADIITYDRPADDQALVARAARLANYAKLKACGEELLDVQQADWILRGITPMASAGNITGFDNLPAALSHAPDMIVIASGVARNAPRGKGETVSPLVAANTPYFHDLGKQIADTYVEHSAGKPFPFIINTGNPVDTMTELLIKSISGQLAEHMRTTVYSDATRTAALLKTIKEIPNRVLGQGGVIDSSRAAFTLRDLAGVALDQLSYVPVVGPHNANMVVDFGGILLNDGGSLYLRDDLKEKVAAETAQGFTAVLKSNEARAGLSQTAVFGTAAAVCRMVLAALGTEKETLCASVYDPLIGRGMGREIHLNHEGITFSRRILDDRTIDRLNNGRNALDEAFAATQTIIGKGSNPTRA